MLKKYKARSKNQKHKHWEILASNLCLLEQPLNPNIIETTLANMYVAPQEIESIFDPESREILETTQDIFPQHYLDGLDLVWHQPIHKFEQKMAEEFRHLMPNETLAENFEISHLGFGIPRGIYGFQWENEEDLDHLLCLEETVIQELCLAFLSVEEILSKSMGESNHRQKPQNRTGTDDEEDYADRDFTDYSGLKDIQNEQIRQCAILYSEMYEGQVILDYVCILLADSLYYQCVAQQDLSYNSIAILLHYLFTKMGPESFVLDRQSYDENGITIHWDIDNVVWINQEQYYADMLYQSVEAGIQLLNDHPDFLHSLICHFQTLARSIYSILLEQGLTNPNSDSRDFMVNFVKDPTLTDMLLNLAWPQFEKKNQYINSEQHASLHYSLIRENINERLITV